MISPQQRLCFQVSGVIDFVADTQGVGKSFLLECIFFTLSLSRFDIDYCYLGIKRGVKPCRECAMKAKKLKLEFEYLNNVYFEGRLQSMAIYL